MIEVKNLTKRYGQNLALDRVSFKIEEGTIVGFLGPNVAGKSTAMNIITGYLSATSGEVTVSGKNTLEEPNEVKKMIGYLPELDVYKRQVHQVPDGGHHPPHPVRPEKGPGPRPHFGGLEKGHRHCGRDHRHHPGLQGLSLIHI